MKKVNKKKGFTLAELLVVIAILAVLIAIAVPIFGGALDTAKQTAINSNARALRSAGMVKILTENIEKGSGANGGWKVVGSVDAEGNMSVTSVTAVDDATIADELPTDVASNYTVYLEPTDVG